MARQSAQAVASPLIKSVLFVVATLAVLVLIGIELGGGGLLRDRNDYSAVFTDSSGIKAGESVRIAGVKVGVVNSVELVDNTMSKVDFAVDTTLSLPSGVQPVIRYLNLTGDRYLELKEGPPSSASLAPGAVIPVSQTTPALNLNVLLAGFSPLFEGLDPGQINDLSGELVNVLQGQGGTVESILQRTASLTNTLADRDALIGSTVDNLNSVLTTLDERGPQVSATIDNLDKLITGLSNQRGRLGDSLQSTTNLVNGVNTLLTRVRGPLRDAVPQIDRLSTLLNQGRGDVNAFLRDLPGGYLRISRLGSRGSTYNLFICALRVKVTGPDGKPLVFPSPDTYFGPNPNLDRCKPNIAPLETPEQRIAKEGK